MDLFLSLAFQEQSKEDGLTVMCRGCGVQKLMTKFIQFYCYGSETHHQSQVEEDERKLVFVINVKDEEQGGGRHKQSDEQTIMDTLLAEGVPPNRLPTLLTSKTKMEGRREEVFGRGGCFICTSRILIVDLLDGKVDAKRISGILVPDAHEIAEGGVEAFIIRKYRESNQSGFVKAFSDQPEEFTGDFGKIDKVVHEATITRNAYPSPLNYHGYPKSCCTSINEIICHGIPDTTKLQAGMIMNIDVTIYHDGVHGDCSETVFVGGVEACDPKVRDLVVTTYEAWQAAIDACKPGVKYNELGGIIEDIIKPKGYSSVREFCGHGIGRVFHAAPNVLHYRNAQKLGTMAPGHCFTIEPMICMGSAKPVNWPDKWTAATADGKHTAQFEHTLLITEDGVDALTGKIEGSPKYGWER